MRSGRRTGHHGRQHQRGAAAVFAGLALAALLASIALVIDIGRLYGAQRELNNAANIAALDAARVVGQCDGAATLSPVDVRQAAQASLTRNDAHPETIASAVIRLGREVSGSDGLRRFETSEGISEGDADAVHVTLRQPAPLRIIPFMRSDAQRTLRAHAAAHQPVVGTLSVKSQTLQLNTEEAALLGPLVGGLLGGSISLSVASFEALLGTMVDLGVLAAEVGVSQTQLLDVTTSLPGALQLVGDVLAQLTDGTSQLAAATLHQLADAADPNRSITFGDILDIDPDLDTRRGEALVNAADLLMALAQAAGSGVPITLPLGINLPGLVSTEATVTIGEPPQIAVGRPGFRSDGTPRTVARSAQVQVNLDLRLLQLLGSTVRLNLDAEVGQGMGWIEEVRCARSEDPVHRSSVRGQAALVSLQAPEQTVLNVIGLVRVNLTDRAAASGGGGLSGPLFDMIGPFVPLIQPPAPETHSGGFGSSSVLGDLVSDVNDQIVSKLELEIIGLGLPIGGLLGNLISLLSPVVSALDEVLAGLFSLLGVSAGGGILTVEALTVEQPRIFSNAPAD